MGNMFNDATNANPDCRNWNVINLNDAGDMFEDSNLSVENLTAIYENWSQLNLQQNVTFGAGNTKYNSSGQAGRDILVNTYNWTITDGSLVYQPFIIEVDTSKAGSASNQFQFTGAQGDYDVIAKQNGTQVANFNDLSNQETITLPSSGVYDLEVSAKEVNGFNRIQFNDGGDKLKITDIKQWGTVVWSSFEESFDSCFNLLATATDAPDLSNVTSLRRMFRFCTKVEPDTTNWDVSNVIDMERMFNFASNCNPNVFLWDVSQVTDMDLMFRFATKANPNARNWNVSNVNLMGLMFDSSALSTENLTACYENWSQLNLQQNVSFSAGNTKYNASGQAGRDILVNTYNWTITDGGQV
jgi:surface protein